jgi:hypothetical protein
MGGRETDMAQAIYAIITDGGRWRISHNGNHYGWYDSEADAVEVATGTARDAAAQGFLAMVVTEAQGGAFRTVWRSDAN